LPQGMRRMDARPPSTLTVNGVTVDFTAATLHDADGTEIPLRAQSFAVLRELASQKGQLVEKDALVEAVWKGVAVTDDSLVQCIGEIRRALDDEHHIILRTVPRRGYRLTLPQTPAKIPRRPRDRRLWAALAGAAMLLLVCAIAFWPKPDQTARPPHLAVLPFADQSAGGGLDYLGNGVAEDIISMLVRSPDVVVIMRSSSFEYRGQPADLRSIGAELGVDYLVEGSVRREGDRLRIIAQLIDARTGRNLWAERFDEAGSDPYALHDKITGRIIWSLTGETGELKRAQYREAWGKDSSELGEYDYYLRGLEIFIDARSKEYNDRAGAIWREGLKRYPNSQMLKVKLAWYHWTAAWNFWSDDLPADFAAADRLVKEVLQTEHLSPEVLRVAVWLNAFVMMYRGNFDAAVAEAHMAVELAPYDGRMLENLSEVLLSHGLYDTALTWLDQAEARSPVFRKGIHQMRGNTLRLMDRCPEALAEFAKVPDLFVYMRLVKAICQVRMGQPDAAQATVREALVTSPEFTRTLWREASFYSDPAILDAELADLEKAGLPD
jgi:adenylate cyclase